jgi:uncharacterized membrane protein
MRALARLLTTTLVGGVLFLVPIVLTIFIATSAVKIAGKVLDPIAHLLPLEGLFGLALRDVAAALLLIVACFIAGLIARTQIGNYVNRRLEGAVLRKVPAFTFVKSAAQGLLGLETGSEVQTALARIEDAWVPAFIVERHRSGLLTVFVPSVPTPAAGTVYLLEESRVRRLDVPVTAMVPVIMALGAGLRDLLEPAQRTAPPIELHPAQG